MSQPPVRLMALATALPPHRLPQAKVSAMAEDLYAARTPGYDRLATVFRTASVEQRASCVPPHWFGPGLGWKERNRVFRASAVKLLEDAARRALDQAGLTPRDIGGVVAVSSTGVITPTLDALLLNALGLPPTIRRMPLFGLGCGGGIIGLSRAADMAAGLDGRPVLLLAVELCTLAFRYDDTDKAAVVAASLFGDGAAAAIVAADGGSGPRLGPSGEHTWPDTLDIMGWRVEDDGLGVVFSGSIPALVQRELRAAAEGFLTAHGMTVGHLAGLLCHPGGPKVLDAVEAAFPTLADGLPEARAVLREHGNMSAVTVLFVLDRALAGNRSGRHLLLALGPGFTAGFLIADLP